MARGGARPGAGRPKQFSQYGERSVRISVPASMRDRVAGYISNTAEAKNDPLTPVLYTAPESLVVPLFSVPAGYPSPAQDYLQEELDITSYMLGPRRASIFLFRIGGHSMKDAGILHDDIIIVDRALDAKDGHIVVASMYGEFTCKYYREKNGVKYLVPANKDYKPVRITEDMEFTIFGRYDGLIRKDAGRWREPFTTPIVEP